MKISRIIGQESYSGAGQRSTASAAGSRSIRYRQRGRGGSVARAMVAGLLLGGLAACGSTASAEDDDVKLALTPSSAQLGECMPDATLDVTVKLTTDRAGADVFEIRARNLPPNREFTVFLLEQAGAPFGAAEYIGDFSTNASGAGRGTFKLIVQEAFVSTRVDGQRVRVDLNRIGVWFADPADDDFCLGANSPVTPFDGDNEAGVQVFNSAAADPLPAP